MWNLHEKKPMWNSCELMWNSHGKKNVNSCELMWNSHMAILPVCTWFTKIHKQNYLMLRNGRIRVTPVTQVHANHPRPYLAKRPPLVPGLQATKSLRNDLSLDCQQNGRFPSKACIMVGGWERAKPLPNSSEWAPNICQKMTKSRNSRRIRTSSVCVFIIITCMAICSYSIYYLSI